ncbi:uncharacterized protein LOC107967934 [Pan troglodytes]|uniref:uncharacterized protein LOC107967934 n=1 Tax=Pan troglodytes TaxID=9598 RepID=UPI0023F36D9B|nr:uncharacterized protein LOC107967934 [Pan troglodytes]
MVFPWPCGAQRPWLFSNCPGQTLPHPAGRWPAGSMACRPASACRCAFLPVCSSGSPLTTSRLSLLLQLRNRRSTADNLEWNKGDVFEALPLEDVLGRSPAQQHAAGPHLGRAEDRDVAATRTTGMPHIPQC